MAEDRRARGIELVTAWYRAALAAVEPATAVERHLRREGRRLVVDDRRVPVDGRLVVVAVGKAAVGMTRGAIAVCGDLIERGVVITKEGHAASDLPARFQVREAAHPVPDERGVRATREVLALVDDLTAADVVLALISGGGSALLEAPIPPLTLDDLAATTDLLLRAGAPIQDLNAVRSPLSLVKGGGLRRVIGPAPTVTLILSDVLGNEPRVIASGPTVPARRDVGRALELLGRYRLRSKVPAAVIAALEDAGEAEGQGVDHDGDVLAIVGDNRAAVEAMAAAARADGMRPESVWREREGEASELGREWVAACRAAGVTDVLLGGGEATVTVRGEGVGGRNTEFALAAALALAEAGDSDWVVASLASDGDDGATGAAGAIADAGTVERARAAGVDPVAALRDNDSLRVFEAAGGLVRPGPTGTNVNDVYLAIRLGATDRRT